jgi:hypothetical protein
MTRGIARDRSNSSEKVDPEAFVDDGNDLTRPDTRYFTEAFRKSGWGGGD